MTPAEIIVLTVKVSIFAVVFALGLRRNLADVPYLLSRPGLLARSLLSMNVAMPLFAVAIALLFDLRIEVELALVALSLSPVPPLLPRKQTKAGGDKSFGIGLLVVFALLSVLWIPLMVPLIGNLFGRDLAISPWPIARIVLVLILVPLVLGLGLHRFAPALATRIEPLVNLTANLTLFGAAGLVVFSARHAILAQIGDGTVLLLVAFVLVGLATGHLLGGPDPGERADLALTTACRHPGIALAIAQLTFPDVPGVKAVVVIYLVVNILIGLVYIRWRRARAGTDAGPT